MQSWAKLGLQACHVALGALACWEHDHFNGLAALMPKGFAKRAEELHHNLHWISSTP